LTGTDDQLMFEGPLALAARVRGGEVHPRELVERCLRRIEALDPKLNAFRVILAEEALAAAEATPTDGLLAGVPVAIKDDQHVAGQARTRGSRSHGPVEERDGEVVRRLRAAGAIPIGITNVPELMLWPWTATAANGITRNPWDPSRSPGGSSGGSATAVASGMVPAATGSDGAGSIRIPAACCGLVGMKPTRGRVSMDPLREGWLGLSVFGALARTVRDSALLLDVLQGALPSDADPAAPPAGSYLEAASTTPKPLRVAASRKVPPGLIARLTTDQRVAWERAGRLLEQLGHDVVPRDPAYGLAAIELTQNYLRGVYEDSLTIPDRSLLEPSSRTIARAGRLLVPPRRRDRLRANRAQTTARVLSLWDQADVLLTPGLARTALPAEGRFGKPGPFAFDFAARFTPWTPVFNLTGQPAIALPAGFGSDGLPLSVQLVGRPGAEDVLYGLAAQLEEAGLWTDQRPPL
jgi:amidase